MAQQQLVTRPGAGALGMSARGSAAGAPTPWRALQLQPRGPRLAPASRRSVPACFKALQAVAGGHEQGPEVASAQRAPQQAQEAALQAPNTCAAPSEPTSSGRQSPASWRWMPARKLWAGRGQKAQLGAPSSTASQPNQAPSAAAEIALLGVTAGAAALLGVPLLGQGAFPGDISSQPFFVAQALAILAAIVAVHEAGHFTAARAQGIHVTKFAIGFGPPLITFTRGEVEYSLRAVPLGGYVAFPDDDPESKYEPDDPNLLRNRSIPERAAVISAGVIANILFAYLCLLVQVTTVGKAETAYLAGVNMPSVDAASVAAAAGFRSGDIITAVDGYDIQPAPGQVSKVVSIIQAHPNERLQFTVQREGAPALVTVVPEAGQNGLGRIGVSLTPSATIRHVRGSSVAENVAIATAEFNRLGATVLNGLKSIVTNFAGVASQVSGPVAIVVAGADIAKTDSAGLFQFCAIVNLNLAVVNTLPLPALDGGYLLLLALEAARGRKLPDQLEQGFMASGFLLLMAMGVSLVVKDTISLIPGL